MQKVPRKGHRLLIAVFKVNISASLSVSMCLEKTPERGVWVELTDKPVNSEGLKYLHLSLPNIQGAMTALYCTVAREVSYNPLTIKLLFV